MLPVLLDLKFIKIYTFGVLLVLAFFWSTFLMWRNIRLSSHKEEEIFDGAFFAIAGALFFARLLYVILHFDKFGFNIARFILINGYPGASLYGAVFGGVVVFYIYCVVHKISFLGIIDYLISPLFLAIAIGKMGSFFSGVEVGVKTKFPLAIRFAGYDGLRHPVTLYESLFFFLGAFIAYKIMFAVRRETFQKGFSLSFFLVYFSAVLFLFAPLKSAQPSILKFDFNRMASLTMLLTSSLYFLYYFRSRFLKIRFPKVTKK